MAAPTKRHALEEENVADVPSKRTSLTSDGDKLMSFIEWTKKHNFNLSAKVTVSQEGSCAQYGMLAVEDIAEGEVLFHIPRYALLSPETTEIAKLLSEEQKSIQGNSGWAPLLISLMYEYNNRQSLWRPYMDLVPDFTQLDLPMFWTSDERDSLLAGSGVIEAVNKDLDNIEKEFNNIVLPFINKHPKHFSSICKDINFYKKMVAFVMAYSFTEQDKQEEEDEEEDSGSCPPVMAPMADILNHVANNNAHLKFEKDEFKMVATKDIKKGEEVYNTYGELSNYHLLHMYGFAEKYPNNNYDMVEIPSEIIIEASSELEVNTKELIQKKKDLLEEVGLSGADVSFVVDVTGIASEEEMFQILKVLCMEEKEFEVYCEDEGWEEEEDVTDSGVENLQFETLHKGTESLKHILRRSAECKLKPYKTSLQEDEVLIKSEQTLSSRQKFSLYTIYGQKKLLHTLWDSCTK